MKFTGTVFSNDGEVAEIELMDGRKTCRLFTRQEGSADDFRAAFPEGGTVAVKQEWLSYDEETFSTAMAVLQKLRGGAGYAPGQQQQITVAVPSALHARLDEWNDKRLATAARMQKLPRTLRYDYLRSEGIPAAIAKGLRDKPAHVNALPLQGNKGAEVQLALGGIRVPVLDRQALIPIEWPTPVAVITRVNFAKQEASWEVTVFFQSKPEDVAPSSEPEVEDEVAA